ncbi:MAG: antibiotic biosynthesis monooxygenase [Candidatus Obscuribacterales bacterium]|nr:antibiotic biosynthesis monooxygenase [Candidatus Obscuribacterales bacterium]
MFAVIYRFKVKAERHEQFVSAWKQRTEEIKANLGGLGSRLHRAREGSFLAYAQWPDRETWLKAQAGEQPQSEPSRLLRESCLEIETLFELELLADLLEKFES